MVQHCRRYEIYEAKEKLKACGFIPVRIQKILGPLEKLTMVLVVVGYLFVRKIGIAASKPDPIKAIIVKKPINIFMALFKLANKGYAKIVWLYAKIMPRIFSTVLLMKCTLHENLKR